MAVLAVTALYMMIFLWVSWCYLRRRDPLLRDVMLVFAAVAVLFVLGVVRVLIGPPPQVVAASASALLLAQPVLTLRLVGRLRSVPQWLQVAAVAGWVLTTLPVVVLPAPLPPPVVWPAVGVFCAVEAVAAGLLAAEARRRAGAARARLQYAAAGTALFGVTLLIAGGGSGVAVWTRSLAVVSGLLYVLAFVPPRRLRQSWSREAANTVLRYLLAIPADEPAARTWQQYCQGARQMFGADAVAVVLPTAAGTVRAVTSCGLSLPEYEYEQRDVDEVLVATTTVDALAGASGSPRLAVALAQAGHCRFVTAAPVPTADGRGAVVLLSRYRRLFADDDVSLLTELGEQAAALAQRATVLAQRATALAEQQSLAKIVESSHDAIISKTLDGLITSWNAGAERLYGYARDEVLGQPSAMLFPPGHELAEAQLMQDVARGERIEQHEVQRRRKDGTVLTVALTLSPITGPDGHITGVAAISRDISERHRAEAMFRGLLEAAPDAIIGVTRGGTITLINAQTERMFGYQRDDLIGQSIDVLVPERVRPRHPQLRDAYFADPRAGQLGVGKDLTAVRKDGSEFPVEISLSALETDQGVIVSAAVRDVTERLHAQNERERLIAQAERDAGERRLQHARRLESLGQLAGGVAHDFNNILAVITNYSELLLDTLDTTAVNADDLAGARNDIGQISRAAERATQLTKQLLAFGRRDITQAEVLNLNHVIGDVEQMLRRTLGEHIHLITQLDRQLQPVYADASQIEQILVNLAVNARDAMPDGGTLSIDTTNADLDDEDVASGPLEPGRYVRLRVSDTGSGMPPDVIERAFEPFYTTKPHGSGTGLGLATVYGIATAAGGDVRLYSENGIGTTITILLPAVDTPAALTPADAAAGPEVQAAGPRPHETILMVEDEDALRQVTGRILTRAGYHVLAANCGAQAIHLAHTHAAPIDLLLTDVIMPKMLGNEVAARIQAIRPGIPVLYMSGYAQPVLTENGTLPDGVTIVEKPFTSRELLHHIHTDLHPPGTHQPATAASASARPNATPEPIDIGPA
ncbi:PAS domain S-box protein [Actinoplanes sp. NPDC089786]|uniref:PAS domain S-box protein n=1 Tax=Actinoplanes sp. NPDC089786 TaxID=3155185 RepID=UPI00342523EC